MKIKDILASLGQVKDKVQLAHKISKCNPVIKNAIKKLLSEEVLVDISVCMKDPRTENNIVISSFDLVNFYGFQKMSALFFLDDLDKAWSKRDWNELYYLLTTMEAGPDTHNMRLNEETLMSIRNNNPEVWAEYQKIVEEEQKQHIQLERDFENLCEEEL